MGGIEAGKMGKIESARDLDVYKLAFTCAVEIKADKFCFVK